jgi:hypothetical protein
MTKLGSMTAIVAAALLGCGGGTDQPPDAGFDAARPPDAAPDAPPEGTPITFTVLTFEGVPESDDVVLISDNGGAWRPMASTTTGVYTAHVEGPRYVIARGCVDLDFQYTEAWLFHLTVAEATELTDLGCHAQAATVRLSGALVGVGADQRGAIATAAGTAIFPGGAADYALEVPPGPIDILGRLHPNVSSSQPRPTQRLYLARDVAVDAPGPVVRDIDFATDGFDPVTHTFDVTGSAAGSARTGVTLYADGPFGLTVEANNEDTNAYHAIPADRLVAGERMLVSRSSQDGRYAALVVDAPADLTAAYPAPYTPPAPTLAQGTPIVRLAGTLPHVDGTDVYEVNASWLDDETFDFVYWAQLYTAGYAGDAAVDYELPDLRGIGGWDIALPPGEITWNASVTGSALTARLPTFLDLEYVVGDIIVRAGTGGTLPP